VSLAKIDPKGLVVLKEKRPLNVGLQRTAPSIELDAAARLKDPKRM